MKVALIGSGISSIGAIMSLVQRTDISVDHYLGCSSKNSFNYKYLNGQPASSLSAGGLSQHWHGVIPITNYHRSMVNFDRLFNHFYPKNLVDNYDLFVPLRPFRGLVQTKKNRSIFKGNYKNILDLVIQVERTGTRWKVKCNAGQDSYDLVILCAGDIETLKILGINPSSAELYDHVNGYLGTADNTNFNPKLETCLTIHGHSKKIFSETSNSIFMCRPVVSKKTKINALAQINYGLTKSGVIADLLKNLNVNKLNEAFYNRFGVRCLKGNTSSLHFQKTVKVRLDETNKELFLCFEKSMFDEMLATSGPLSSIKGFNPSESNYYPGTHIRAKLPVSYDLGKNMITGLLDRQDVMSPYHHSFVKLVTTFNRVQEFFGE